MEFQLSFPLLDQYGAPLLLALFLALLAIEWKWPLRRWVGSYWRRALTNAVVAAPTFVVLRLGLIPLVVGTAYWAERQEFGVFNWLDAPYWLGAAVGFLWLDYALYVWHWLNHQIPLLWRFHNVHHSDLNLSITTAVRFHFGEMLISALFRAAAVAVVGVAPIVVLVYEIAFEGSVAFHHSNWRLPLRLERALSWLFVTPRMHGIHHSIVQREANSNYSNMFSFWDRLHRTLRLNIRQKEITIGVPGYRDAEEHTIKALLSSPFRKQKPYWRSGDDAEPDPERPGDRGSFPRED